MPLPFAGPSASLAAWPVSNLAGTNLRAATVFLPETQALFARMTTPPTYARAVLMNALIGSLVTAGVWAKLDSLYVLANYDEQAATRNWVADAYNLTVVNTPVFAADRGYTGALTRYLDTTFNPSTAAGLFTANAAHLGVWNRTAGMLAGIPIGGRQSFSSRSSMVIPRLTGDQTHFAVNRNGSQTVASLDGTGHFVANRSGAAASQGYRNGVGVTSDTSATDAITDLPLFILGINQAGALAAVFLGEVAAGHFGGSLSAPETAALYAALLVYMQAVGAA